MFEVRLKPMAPRSQSKYSSKEYCAPHEAKRKICLVSDYVSQNLGSVGRQTFFFIKTFLYRKSLKIFQKGLNIDFNIAKGFKKV